MLVNNRKQIHIIVGKLVLILLCLLFSFQSFAQQSSVTVTTQFFPPYSLKLSDYATSTDEKLAVQLLLNDITEVNRSVRLRMYIENKNVAIKTVDFPTGETPLFLDGGFPLRLSNLDIGYLFQLQNLQGINAATYNESLPEGLYQFCFEVYDALTNVRLSQKSCTPVYLVQNDPPILNLPTRGEIVAQQDVQNIIFQWTPRHLNATNIEYEFTLKELWDNYADPQAAFLSSAPLHQATSFAPTFLYGIGEPQLLPNKRYAWQVRAISRTGISENSVFKNNGYSEIFHFIYTADCNVPQYLLSEAQSLTKVKVMWQADADQTKFNVQYRKKNVKDAVWFDRPVQNAQETNLYSLQSDTTYEFRVGSNCIVELASAEVLYTYSGIQEFKTPKKGEGSSYNCGYVPNIEITNVEPLEGLGVNEVFTAGDFPVTVKEVNSENSGSFTGWGFIVVPYLADTRIKVSFSNIKINTDSQLIQGVVLTTYDPTWSGVNDIANEIEAVTELLSSLIDALSNFGGTQGEIEEIESYVDDLASQIDDIVNNPDIPAEIRDFVSNLYEEGGNAVEGLASDVKEYGTSGPNGDGYTDNSNRTEASNSFTELQEAIEKAEMYLEISLITFPHIEWLDEHDCVDLEGDRIYLSPAGIPVSLPKNAKPRFLKENTLKIPFGVLKGFTLGNETYEAYYYKDKFKGYKKQKGDDPYKFSVITKPKELMVIVPQPILFVDCSYFFFISKYNSTVINDTGIGDLLINKKNPLKGEMQLVCEGVNYSTCLPDVSRVNYDKYIWGHYNYFGNGGFLRLIQNDQKSLTYLYSVASGENGEVELFQFNQSEGKWYYINEPPHDCLSCDIAWMFEQLFDPKEMGHMVLDIAGMVPVIGEAFDAANGVWYIVEGEYGNATLSFTSAIPLVYATSVKYVGRIVKLADGTNQIFKVVNKNAKEFINIVNKLKLNDDALKRLNLDFNNKAFANAIAENPKLIDAWEMLLRNGRTGLKTDVDALTSLNTLLNNSKLAGKLASKNAIEIENLLANMKGWSGASYKQVCDKVNLLVAELPANVTGLDKYLGSAGFGNGNVYTNRHSWVQLERLLLNKQKIKVADELIFENPISFSGYNSVTDIYLRIGTDVFEIETKAGIRFFENVTSNSSNFSKQSFNSLNNVDKLENYKVFLNPTIKNALGNSDKLNVINAWKNWEGGTLLANDNILNIFTDFARRTSGNTSIPKFTSQTLENYLMNSNSWFDSIFKTDLLP